MDSQQLTTLAKMVTSWLLILSNKAKMQEKCFCSIRCLDQKHHKVCSILVKFNWLDPLNIDGNTSQCAEQIYVDTQPLIRSVLDGFNVCIFAYGQTGSGKTYTMVI